MPGQDYYSILDVSKDASNQDIKKAFRKIARECHPDVAGDDPVLAERFKVARTAYETLMDPMTRGRYDRRGQRRSQGGGAPGGGGSFFDAFYKRTERSGRESGPSYGNSAAGGHSSTRGAKSNPDNHLDLDDLFNDFGDFGFGNSDRRRTRSTARDTSPPPPNRDPVAGDDVQMELDVPAQVAAKGGSVTAVYYRMQRADSWRPGSPDPGLVRVQDIADVRVVPGCSTGEVLRERGLGNAGAHGGPYGDLLVRLRVVGTVRPDREPSRSSRPESGSSEPGVVEISVVEAILGGRVELQTPQGVVRITIPAGTSSGARLRLKGKGKRGPSGQAEDLYVRVRIVVPRQLDEESRTLIEEFARLNPGNPRE